MYIVAIAWLYVTVLMAATEPSLVGGVLTFLAYGAAPLALFLYLFGRRRPRSAPAGEPADQPDQRHAEADQQHLLRGRAEGGPPVQARDQIGDRDVDHARRG